MHDQNPNSVRSGDVLLVENNSIFARIIRWRTDSRYSHAALIVRTVWNGETDVPCIIEAQAGMPISLTPLNEYVKRCATTEGICHWFALRDGFDRERIVAFALNQLGKRYADVQQFAVSFGWVTPWLRKLCGRNDPDTDPDRFFCSEFVASSLQEGGVKLFGSPAAISPGQLVFCDDLVYQGILRVK